METSEQVANATKAVSPLGLTCMPEDIGFMAASSDEARWLTAEIIFGSGGLR